MHPQTALPIFAIGAPDIRDVHDQADKRLTERNERSFSCTMLKTTFAELGKKY